MVTVISIILMFVAFFICLSVHEAAHAFISNKLGDPTSKHMGRMTLNPLAHIDIFGTVLIPLLLISQGLPAFGWAKPVMVDPRNFDKPSRDNFLTSLAGPVSNIVFAFLIIGLIKLIPALSFLAILVRINIILALFNLIPVPPLDGSKVWHLFLSDESYYTLEQMGPFILIAFLIFINSFGGALFTYIDQISNAVLSLI